MSAPEILRVYPTNSDVGIPIGISIEILFDKGIDLEILKQHVVLYGRDFDETSGPNSALWIDPNTGDNPFFLRSPGFQGVVDLDFTATYVDTSTETVATGTITSEADELYAGIGHLVLAQPRTPLAPDVEYTLYIMGDPDDVGRGVSSRTVFDVEPSAVSTTGVMRTAGSYEGGSVDTVTVKITTAGDIGTAKYKWWYVSEGEGSARLGKVTARRNRKLEDGLQIRFDGSGFLVNDTYSFNVEPIERLVTNTKIIFTTNDGSYSLPPDSPSTPATSSPPSSVLIPGGSTSVNTTLYIVETEPPDGSYNISGDQRTITVVFSEEINPATITQDTVTVTMQDVKGYYGCTSPPRRLAKRLSVDGNTLTIEL